MQIMNANRHAAVEVLEPRRLLSAGDPDLSFGVRGVAPVFPATTYHTGVGTAAGGVLVAGAGYFARLTASGKLDPTFGGGDGIAQISSFPDSYAVAIQPNGKILVLVADQYRFPTDSIARLNADGTLDTAFGGRGEGIVHLPQGLIGASMLNTPDGGVVVAGTLYDPVFGALPAVAKL